MSVSFWVALCKTQAVSWLIVWSDIYVNSKECPWFSHQFFFLSRLCVWQSWAFITHLNIKTKVMSVSRLSASLPVLGDKLWWHIHVYFSIKLLCSNLGPLPCDATCPCFAGVCNYTEHLPTFAKTNRLKVWCVGKCRLTFPEMLLW